MERIERLFPRYDENGKTMILRAYLIADEALREQKRSNGAPFMEHPVAVAKIACDEIGLSAECVAAVFLHEATRFFPETDIASGGFGNHYALGDGQHLGCRYGRERCRTNEDAPQEGRAV